MNIELTDLLILSEFFLRYVGNMVQRGAFLYGSHFCIKSVNSVLYSSKGCLALQNKFSKTNQSSQS